MSVKCWTPTEDENGTRSTCRNHGIVSFAAAGRQTPGSVGQLAFASLAAERLSALEQAFGPLVVRALTS